MQKDGVAKVKNRTFVPYKAFQLRLLIWGFLLPFEREGNVEKKGKL